MHRNLYANKKIFKVINKNREQRRKKRVFRWMLIIHERDDECDDFRWRCRISKLIIHESNRLMLICNSFHVISHSGFKWKSAVGFLCRSDEDNDDEDDHLSPLSKLRTTRILVEWFSLGSRATFHFICLFYYYYYYYFVRDVDIRQQQHNAKWLKQKQQQKMKRIRKKEKIR